MPEFVAWPKTPRLSKSLMVITEKIDGTNAAIGFSEDGEIWCQSRKRVITPDSDNFGFAAWAYAHREPLFKILNPGLHFGEWWGSGIQRGYGLEKGEKRFSLFNTAAYGWMQDLNPEAVVAPLMAEVPGLSVVPVLDTHTLDTGRARGVLGELADHGSVAAPGFDRPEGICVYVRDVDRVFKMTFDGDDHKGAACSL